MKAKIVLAAIVAMIMVAVMAMPAVAVPATTLGEVTGAGTDPVIEEIFELDNEGLSAPTTVSPDPITGFKEVCVYVVMSDATGSGTITDVEITVDFPLGTQKAYGDTTSGNVVEVSGSDVNTATQMAYDQGLIDAGTQSLINTNCAAGLWRLQEFCFDMESCDEAGNYNVEVIAYDDDGNDGTDSNYFVYASLKHLATDFTTINFGTITPGAESFVDGDADTTTPNKPTVSSCANDPFKLTIYADDMTDGAPNAIIDATSQYACVYGDDVGGIPYSQKLPLSTAGVSFTPIIDTCEDEPIDFFVLQSSILKGSYDGTITLEAVSV